jgi:hypothetical protein
LEGSGTGSGVDQAKEVEAVLVKTSQRLAEGARYRVRTTDPILEHQPLASPDSQGDSQNLSDPILARLVRAWPVLSEERKKIIDSLLKLA